VVAVLQELGANVIVISRSGSNNYTNLSLHTDASVIVNTTPVGMYPKTEFSPLSEKALSQINTKHFYDLIYNPLETKLMKNMREKGVNVSGGMDMLVWQAVAAHTIWDSSQYDEKDIKQLF
jgi:shikimate dehydrogenase